MAKEKAETIQSPNKKQRQYNGQIKKTKGQSMIDKILLRKQSIKQQRELHKTT